jgi:hypothetical protein
MSPIYLTVRESPCRCIVGLLPFVGFIPRLKPWVFASGLLESYYRVLVDFKYP